MNGVGNAPPTDPAPTRPDIPVARPGVTVNRQADDLDAPIYQALVAEHGTTPV